MGEYYGGPHKDSTVQCPVCSRVFPGIGESLKVCPDCLRTRWNEGRIWIEAIHEKSRRLFQLPTSVPRSEDGLTCKICFHECRMRVYEPGYCGIRRGSGASFRHDGRRRAHVSYYLDPLPTNCVADWVCAGGTGAGYPRYAHDRGPEAGYYNLAVFFEACNFNCLYCQNWHFKKKPPSEVRWHSVEHLVGAVNQETSCICFFGGDPVPQLPYALRVSRRARDRNPDRILRICWETNGSMNPAWVKSMAKLSLDSGGCIKFDLKAWDRRIHQALCGVDNRQVLENFQRLSQFVPLRPSPPLVVASTLLVPGYVGPEEIHQLASFIARLNPDIPYSLLAFAPQFCMGDFPTTSRAQADQCLEAARQAGLRRVRVGNRHLLH